MSDNWHTCSNCGLKFNSARNNEEAIQEYKNADYYLENAETDVVCSDCYEIFMEWYNSLPAKERKNIMQKAKFDMEIS